MMDNSSHFKKSTFVSFISLSVALLTYMGPAQIPAFAQVVSPAYNPIDNDGKVGSSILGDGSTVTITTQNSDVRDSFATGSSPNAQIFSLDALNGQGKILGGAEYLDTARLNIGSATSGISIPDVITGGSVTIQTYNSANFTPEGTVGATTVGVYDNVNNQQYIDMQIGKVTNGTMNVEMGDSSKLHTDDENKLALAAKQSTLFVADGTTDSANLVWQGKNRIIFNAVSLELDPATNTSFSQRTVQNVAEYGGSFSVTTLDNQVTSFDVTDVNSLKLYNDWLITQLQAGNLNGSDYKDLFALGVTTKEVVIKYEQLATPPDEIFQGQGDRIIMRADGPNASIVLASGSILEGEHVSSAVKLTGGATGLIEQGAILSATGSGTDGTALEVTTGSSATNKGVINTNFFVEGSSGNFTTGGVGGFNSRGIRVSGGSTFDNEGIVNVSSNTGTGISSGIFVSGGSSATNHASGIINVGIVNSSARGRTIGVEIVDATSSFVNDGEIHIGREAQFDPTNLGNPGDIKINQAGLAAGVDMRAGGTFTNNNLITIHKETQNAAGIFVSGPNATVNNAGTIDVLGAATNVTAPNTNYGMLVQNSGSGSIVNSGTINLLGVNSVGIKALSDNSATPTTITTTASSHIYVAGGKNIASGTRNYGQDLRKVMKQASLRELVF